jgi:hypothetical protein
MEFHLSLVDQNILTCQKVIALFKGRKRFFDVLIIAFFDNFFESGTTG